MPANALSRVGVYVDVSNIYLNGGQRLRFEVLRQYAEKHGTVIRLNAYVSMDDERSRQDQDYRERILSFFDALRSIGWHTVIRMVRYYVDPETGARFGKANSDVDMAVDCLVQARNLDIVILVTGDGDFIRLVQHIQNYGSRVQVMGFENVSRDLREQADTFISGYMIPELLPTNRREKPWGVVGSVVRGNCYYHQADENFGFMSFLKEVSSMTWISDPRQPDSPYKAAFFHDSSLPAEINPRALPSRSIIFEFELNENDRGLFAESIRVV